MTKFHIMFLICLPITFLCIFGFCRKSGLWEVLIKLFCVFFATLFALALFEPVANLFDKMMTAFAYYNDMWAFLLVFVVILAIELFITNRLSRVNVQIPPKPNKAGAMLTMFLLFLGFYFVAAQTFYYLLPERPDYNAVVSEADGGLTVSNPIQFQLLELFSRGSLSGQNSFSYKTLYTNQFKRKSAVYFAVGGEKSSSGSGDATWKFKDHSSPNLK